LGRRIVASAAALAALVVPAAARAYPWPLKPFDRPHPIRAAFDDPRYHLGDADNITAAFHFGVDISAADGTPVYSVSAGKVSRHAASVTVQHRGAHEYGYWHILPVVWTGQHVHVHQLLGFVAKGWGHVHFAERVRGRYVNPLRPAALTPFSDKTAPFVASVSVVQQDRTVAGPLSLSGPVDVVADIYDLPPLAPAAPWQVARLAPALVRWRLLNGSRVVFDWRVVVDFRRNLMPDSLYGWVYAPGTYQNKANRPGRYLFWIAHDFDTSELAPGSYSIEVEAMDTRGNTGTNTLAFTIPGGTT
jgi:murein DD-endopeptidase MepM/ murein hydrolase activator NlpD